MRDLVNSCINKGGIKTLEDFKVFRIKFYSITHYLLRTKHIKDLEEYRDQLLEVTSNIKSISNGAAITQPGAKFGGPSRFFAFQRNRYKTRQRLQVLIGNAIGCYSWQLWQPRLQAATRCLTSPGCPQWPTRNSYAIESWDRLCLDLTGTLQGPKNSNIFRSKWIHPHSSSTDRYFASCDKSVKDLNMRFRPARGVRIHPQTARDALRWGLMLIWWAREHFLGVWGVILGVFGFF